MAQCPHCKAEIDHLILVGTVREQYYFEPGGHLDAIEGGNGDLEEREYRCPKCHKTIFSDVQAGDAEEQAISLLN